MTSRRRVGVLLSNMGKECVRICDSFALTPEVAADEEAAIAAQPRKNTIQMFFEKFEVRNYRNIKRQGIFQQKRGNLGINDYIAKTQLTLISKTVLSQVL
ncbi:hypothetical protein DPMN_084476 [Dreissena polymorpha]|uniref:Uncharacterized protein n=1 Tax=Dreissena polymorpha TaxID=45954 RepID=A0A9D3YEM3_DREPO|nr:hypothetical protein DPMN_084476 [Dreissena polymorpha]